MMALDEKSVNHQTDRAVNVYTKFDGNSSNSKSEEQANQSTNQHCHLLKHASVAKNTNLQYIWQHMYCPFNVWM